MQVRGLLAHSGEHIELEAEQVRLAHVTVRAAVADHRVLLLRLELLAPDEPAKLVGTKVDTAVDDRTRHECRRDAKERCRHPVDELPATAAGKELAGMHALERIGHHELGAQEADPVHRLRSDSIRMLGHREVHVDLGCKGLGGRGRRLGASGGSSRGCLRKGTSEDATGGRVDGDDLAVVEDGRRDPRADDAGHPELSRDDRRVAGHAAAISDERASSPDRRNPVGARHRGDEDLALLEAASLLGGGQDPYAPGHHTGGGGLTGAEHHTGGGSLLPRLGHGCRGGIRLDERRDRSRLQDVPAPRAHCPLDVLRLAVVVVDAQAGTREVEDLVVAEHPLTGTLRRQLTSHIVSVLAPDDLEPLHPDSHRDQPRPGLVDDIRVGFDGPGDHDLTEAEGRLDDDPRRISGRRIRGEHDTTAL